MVATDQPDMMSAGIKVAVSSRTDGTMLDRERSDRHDATIVANRVAFCQKVGIDYASVAYQIIRYGASESYTHLVEVDRPCSDGVYADILYTETPGVALFLPVADCAATVIYDAKARRLAIAHLGRHSTMANAMTTALDYFICKGSSAADIQIWMAPSVKQASYRMEYFSPTNLPAWRGFYEHRDDGYYLDLQGYSAALAVKAGVLPQNIHVSPVNTAIDPEYFSHSQGDSSGRFAVVVMLTSH